MKKLFLGFPKTQIKVVPDTKGKSIEEELREATTNHEPIEAIAPLIYTAKEDGVMPELDPRTDKQEIALDATDKYAKSEAMKGDTPNETADVKQNEQNVEPQNNE